jgi:nucleotidyltransferase substrate binding protein (TIGR01987 family)
VFTGTQADREPSYHIISANRTIAQNAPKTKCKFMTNPDIRWIQRFQNLTKAMGYLEMALQIPNPDILQKAGIIQFFEMSFELSWNMVKDYLEEQGFMDIKSPRGAIKKAFEMGIIENGHDWMDLLLDRNLTAHTYDEQKATEMEQLIQNKYFPLLKALHNAFKQKLDEE